MGAFSKTCVSFKSLWEFLFDPCVSFIRSLILCVSFVGSLCEFLFDLCVSFVRPLREFLFDLCVSFVRPLCEFLFDLCVSFVRPLG